MTYPPVAQTEQQMLQPARGHRLAAERWT
ncbi:hypothetical protein HU200_023131 [Digitaria exilis]|uniref:Uncharacterized protein n=1 Tax=Digitaria exilis TaxID=1010633 RepID=A0A835C3M1_9POAL|nr:hypothetical protein HU200_023131 [Digitaria exilis]